MVMSLCTYKVVLLIMYLRCSVSIPMQFAGAIQCVQFNAVCKCTGVNDTFLFCLCTVHVCESTSPRPWNSGECHEVYNAHSVYWRQRHLALLLVYCAGLRIHVTTSFKFWWMSWGAHLFVYCNICVHNFFIHFFTVSLRLKRSTYILLFPCVLCRSANVHCASVPIVYVRLFLCISLVLYMCNCNCKFWWMSWWARTVHLFLYCRCAYFCPLLLRTFLYILVASEQKYIHLAFSLCTVQVCECTLRIWSGSERALISVHILGAVDVQCAIVNSGECHDERGLRICFCTLSALILSITFAYNSLQSPCVWK